MSRKIFALSLGALIFGIWGQAGKLSADGPVVVQACGAEGCCRQGRCPHDGVCVPSTETKKIDKRVYTDTCEQFCLPKCPLFGGLFGGGGCDSHCENGACHDGSCHQCEHPRTRKYLVVKIKHEEQCIPACKVEPEGACAAPAGTIQPAPAKPMPAPKPMAGVQPVPQMQVLEYRFMPMPKQ